MRVKKLKRHRKTVRKYTACYGFRAPYKILCDGTIVHHLVAHRLPPQDSFTKSLGAPVQLFTTQCVIEELKSLGSSYVESFYAARKDYKLARCEHEQTASALNCIMEILGENNPEHFFVATQDIELRKKCRKIRGVPRMFGLRNAVYLEDVSETQREFVKADEEERLHATDSEKKLLQKRVKSILSIGPLKDSSSTEEGTGDKDVQGQIVANRLPRKTDAKDKVQFKRKRAKGANPLSCKKKKTNSSSGPKIEKADNTSNDVKRSRTRKRKRSRKTNSALDV